MCVFLCDAVEACACGGRTKSLEVYVASFDIVAFSVARHAQAMNGTPAILACSNGRMDSYYSIAELVSHRCNMLPGAGENLASCGSLHPGILQGRSVSRH